MHLDGAIFGSPQHGAHPQHNNNINNPPWVSPATAPPPAQPRQYKQVYMPKEAYVEMGAMGGGGGPMMGGGGGPEGGALVPAPQTQTVPIRYLEATVVPTYSCVLGMALGDLAIYPTYLQFTAKLCEPEAPVPLVSIDQVRARCVCVCGCVRECMRDDKETSTV